MDKEYVFTFNGTKDAFLKNLDQFYATSGRLYYLDDYIIEIVGEEIRFGAARGGHSGGYWYIPRIKECSNRLEFRGRIQYIGPGTNEQAGRAGKVFERIEYCLLFLLALPVVLIFKLYSMIEWCIRKLCNRPKPKEKTTEERLFDLMENYLGCTGEKDG